MVLFVTRLAKVKHWFYFALRSNLTEITTTTYLLPFLSLSLLNTAPCHLFNGWEKLTESVISFDIQLKTITICFCFGHRHKFHPIFMWIGFLLTKWLKGYVKNFFGMHIFFDVLGYNSLAKCCCNWKYGALFIKPNRYRFEKIFPHSRK